MSSITILSKYALGLTQSECESLNQLIDYNEKDERRDWEENECPYIHIYTHIQRLSDALGRQLINEEYHHCIHGVNISQWAYAIAERIADEWHGKGKFPESTAILRDVLLRLLAANPNECRELIGTGVIETTYFDKEG